MWRSNLIIAMLIVVIHFVVIGWIWSSFEGGTNLYNMKFMIQHNILDFGEVIQYPDYSPPRPSKLMVLFGFPILIFSLAGDGHFTLLEHVSQSVLWGCGVFLFLQLGSSRRLQRS